MTGPPVAGAEPSVTRWQLDSRWAWVIVAAAAAGATVAFGTVYSFGVFFDSMSDDFGVGRGPTALLFGVTLLAYFGSSAVVAPLADRFGPRRFTVLGAVLLPAGLVLTSRVDDVVVGYFTYGIGVGLGGNLVVSPSFTAATGWIVQHRALAVGVMSVGNGLGTLMLVPFAERMITDHGWRTALVILAVVDVVVVAAMCAVMRRPPIPPAPPAFDRMKRIASTGAFRRLFATTVVFGAPLYVAFAFVFDFATAEGVTTERAAFLVALIGAASIAGRLVLTAMSGRLSSVRLMQISLGVQTVAYVVWLLAGGSYLALVVFAVVLGVGFGGFVALAPEVALSYFGVVGVGAMMGMYLLAWGFGGLIGPVLGDFLADASDGTGAPIGFAVAASLVAVALSLTLPSKPDEISALTGLGDTNRYGDADCAGRAAHL